MADKQNQPAAPEDGQTTPEGEQASSGADGPAGQTDGSARLSEKSQFLHRKEIRSMEKDIARTREQEAQGERAHIAQMQQQQQNRREQQLSEQIKQKSRERQTQQQQQEAQKKKQNMQAQAEIRERQVATNVGRQHEEIQEKAKQAEQHLRDQITRQTITPPQPATPEGERVLSATGQTSPPAPPQTPLSQPQQPLRPFERPQARVQGLSEETTPKPAAGIDGPARPAGGQTPPPAGGSSEQLPPQVPFNTPESPEAPSSKSRLIVRLAIIIFVAFIVFNAILFGYWQLQLRGVVPAVSLPFSLPFISQQAETPTSQQDEPTPTSQPTSPSASPTLIPAPSSRLEQILNFTPITLQFGNQQELASLILEAKQTTQLPGLVQLVLQERNTSARLDARVFFEVFGVVPSAAVSSQLQNDALFFVHRDARGSKFGFVAEVLNVSQAQQGLVGWENSLETSLSPLASFWGQKGLGYNSSFRETIYQGIPVRFQTFSTQDVGIVYAFVENYLIFSSSFEGTKALIDELL